MNRIYIGQTKLDLVTKVGQDITGAITTDLKYRKPNGIIGVFNCSIKDALVGELTYSVQSNDLDINGNWKLWAYVVFADGRIGIGNSFDIKVYKEGE